MVLHITDLLYCSDPTHFLADCVAMAPRILAPEPGGPAELAQEGNQYHTLITQTLHNSEYALCNRYASLQSASRLPVACQSPASQLNELLIRGEPACANNDYMYLIIYYSSE